MQQKYVRKQIIHVNLQHNYVDMQHNLSCMLTIIILQVDIINLLYFQHNYKACGQKSHVNMIILHIDIIYLACWGQKYVAIQNKMIIINGSACSHPNIWQWYTFYITNIIFCQPFFHYQALSRRPGQPHYDKIKHKR